jgi:hypothetical protein
MRRDGQAVENSPPPLRKRHETNEVFAWCTLLVVCGADGGVTIHFGGDPEQSNYIPVTKGWNYIVGVYRPRAEILDGVWKFPEAQAVN